MTTVLRSRTRRTTSRLVAKYAAVCLIPVIVLGLVVAASLRSEVHARGLAEGRAEAALFADTAVDPLVGARPLGPRLAASERTALARLARRARGAGEIAELRIRTLTGDVVFTSAGGPAGTGSGVAGAVREAAGGETVATLRTPRAGAADGPRAAAIQIVQPLTAGAPARRIGVLELALPYAPINADVRTGLDHLYLDLGLGLALLCLVLFAITLSVSRGLRRQIAVNLEQAAQLRSSELKYRLLFEENPQPMMAFDRQTLQIVAVSNAAVTRYGYSRDEFLTMTVPDMHPPEDSAAIRRLLEYRARTEPAGSASVRLTRHRHRYKDGTVIDVEVNSDDVVLDGRECRILLCQDVTARNRSTTELAIARDEAIEASNTKSAFLANVSHEIRTPMNGVIGMTELLLESDLTDEQRGYAEHVSRSGEQMLGIVNDILDISKIETGQLELDLADFALHETINQACAVAGIQARSKGLAFEVEIAGDVPRYVHGDSVRVRQILLNLVTNAVKFTAAGSVAVRVLASAPAGNEVGGAGPMTVRCSVIDTGPGIDPARLDSMFEAFTQADTSTTRHFGGTGLGLAIARELTELMGGTIGAESVPGEGSTFWFEIPLGAASSEPASARTTYPPASAAPVSEPLGPHSPLVLVAEDTPVNQIVAVRSLQRCGCRAHVAADGYEALEALLSERYDAVLMDCQMPEMDGYETTSELRRREGSGRRTPVIAMTAHAMKGDLEKCLAAGMDDYLSKPLRHQALAEVLARWIPALAATQPRAESAGTERAAASVALR